MALLALRSSIHHPFDLSPKRDRIIGPVVCIVRGIRHCDAAAFSIVAPLGMPTAPNDPGCPQAPTESSRIGGRALRCRFVEVTGGEFGGPQRSKKRKFEQGQLIRDFRRLGYAEAQLAHPQNFALKINDLDWPLR